MYNFSSQKIILLHRVEDRVRLILLSTSIVSLFLLLRWGGKRGREEGIYIYIYRVLDRGAFDRGSALPVEFQQFDSRER